MSPVPRSNTKSVRRFQFSGRLIPKISVEYLDQSVISKCVGFFIHLKSSAFIINWVPKLAVNIALTMGSYILAKCSVESLVGKCIWHDVRVKI